jgi:hypothetical protein
MLNEAALLKICIIRYKNSSLRGKSTKVFMNTFTTRDNRESERQLIFVDTFICQKAIKNYGKLIHSSLVSSATVN